ncbi:Small RNA degrading nuclease 3 [Vitis vinifera]|uniref:Small RNA degrading nuclease 3 n=1 Tax=Vitis vinifera TaxID=29760 RepID=A0A438KPY4_VITVI|nr:Small RNA degrading nuclease 3 [Vitis vinifera]
MDNTLVNAEKEVLVEMVKLAQKRGLEGSKGSWKDFLSTYDRKLGPSLSDPSRRPVDTLVSFLKTFSKEEDLKALQRLIRLTLEHPQYPLDYSFPSHEEGWMVTKIRQKFKFTRSNAMLAVDCEMVLCEDGTEGLVRVCVVDRNLQVKLNELVKPHKAVVDYRTEITGVSAKDFDETTSSLVDIQRSMKKLLSHGAVLVGHSLHNDLKALKLDHARVIDTAFIYKYENQPINRRPSLNNLCKAMRQKDAPHNCLDDASAAMKLVLAKLEQGLDDAIPFVHEDVPENEMAKLLLHRIPTDVPIEELNRIIPGEFTMEHQVSCLPDHLDSSYDESHENYLIVLTPFITICDSFF